MKRCHIDDTALGQAANEELNLTASAQATPCWVLGYICAPMPGVADSALVAGPLGSTGNQRVVLVLHRGGGAGSLQACMKAQG